MTVTSISGDHQRSWGAGFEAVKGFTTGHKGTAYVAGGVVVAGLGYTLFTVLNGKKAVAENVSTIAEKAGGIFKSMLRALRSIPTKASNAGKYARDAACTSFEKMKNIYHSFFKKETHAQSCFKKFASLTEVELLQRKLKVARQNLEQAKIPQDKPVRRIRSSDILNPLKIVASWIEPSGAPLEKVVDQKRVEKWEGIVKSFEEQLAKELKKETE